MQSYNSIVGLPVIDENTNTKFATVKDILFCSNTKKVSGIIIGEKGIINKVKYIPFENISEIGKTFIKVRNIGDIKEIDEGKKFSLLNSPLKNRIKKCIYTKDGKRLGQVNDMIFDAETGTIEGFSISNGVIEDLISGRRVIDIDKVSSFRQDRFYANEQKVNSKQSENNS